MPDQSEINQKIYEMLGDNPDDLSQADSAIVELLINYTQRIAESKAVITIVDIRNETMEHYNNLIDKEGTDITREKFNFILGQLRIFIKGDPLKKLEEEFESIVTEIEEQGIEFLQISSTLD